jgi:hypothetical protein
MKPQERLALKGALRYLRKAGARKETRKRTLVH